MTIKRYQDDKTEWSPADHFNHAQTGNMPERPEYTEARARALKNANLEDVDDTAPVELADMAPSDHLRRLQAR